MKIFARPSNFFSLILPDNWEVNEEDSDDDPITIFNAADERRVLQFSRYTITNEVESNMVQEFIELISDLC